MTAPDVLGECRVLVRLLVLFGNLHAILHIADTIEQCGPAWAYWCFALERFCGLPQRTIRNRRFPFASLNRRVRDLAQLDQIKTRYNLWEVLDLSTHRRVKEKEIRILGCKFNPQYLFLTKRTLRLDPSHQLLYQRIRDHVQTTFGITLDVAAT
ncbi:hypothetical protein BOTBODRAFT_179804 [Botryobasidium botryosum FD-172 SS1]|uniref:Uncharacterized protein n=1 Tax=Botryobasidium botryosum (strain FD-172 SS1) TaxID=930990 RepID=A0A067MA29_BOTB1|nr:hypothetical protein BOTBODRAFT_179804 [Botryobasidium botryosum FD-172 SS1]